MEDTANNMTTDNHNNNRKLLNNIFSLDSADESTVRTKNNSYSSNHPMTLGLSLKERQNASLSLKRIYDMLQNNNNSVKSGSVISQQVQLDLSLNNLSANTPADKSADPIVNKPRVPAGAAAAPSLPLDQLIQRLSSKSSDDGRNQLTIFYSGMVYTFNAVPLEKARAIMVLAASCCSSANDEAKQPILATNETCRTAMINIISASAASALKRPYKELPYAHKASLGRFLRRRRDRLTAAQSTTATQSDQSGCINYKNSGNENTNISNVAAPITISDDDRDNTETAQELKRPMFIPT